MQINEIAIPKFCSFQSQQLELYSLATRQRFINIIMFKFYFHLGRFQLWKLSSYNINRIIILAVIRYYLELCSRIMLQDISRIMFNVWKYLVKFVSTVWGVDRMSLHTESVILKINDYSWLISVTVNWDAQDKQSTRTRAFTWNTVALYNKYQEQYWVFSCSHSKN